MNAPLPMNEEKQAAVQALKTASGQIDGIVRMIQDGRYCIDISNQLLAASAMLKRANLLILRQHMSHCVKTAVEHGDADEKIAEIMDILSKVMDR